MNSSSRPRTDDPTMPLHRQGSSSDASTQQDRSIHGHSDVFNPHTLVNSLDEAVNKLRHASELSSSGIDHFVRWVGVIAAAKDQQTAVEKLASTIANSGGVSVRVGWGNHSMSRLYDSRLGWLGGESQFFQEASAAWDSDAVVPTYQHFTIENVHGSKRAIFWIRDTASAVIVREFTEHHQTLSGLVWSRPSAWLSRLLTPITGGWFGGGQWPLKQRVIVSVVAIVLLGLIMLPIRYPVNCDVVIETTRARYISTPFEGTLLRSDVKLGDQVKEGDVLFTLDGRPLRIEREQLLAELQEASKQYDSALGSGRIADAQQSKLKREQINRQMQLLTDRLEKLSVLSPIEGVVVSGELEKRVGSPLDRGETMVEIASMDALRIEMEVPDHDIHMVRLGDSIKVRLNAMGNRTFEGKVQQLRPAAEIREDKNVFVATINIDNEEGLLRPGMRGEGVIRGPSRPWIWSYVRELFEKTLWTLGY
jgi:multidrug resistance efflux pump